MTEAISERNICLKGEDMISNEFLWRLYIFKLQSHLFLFNEAIYFYHYKVIIKVELSITTYYYNDL